MINKKARKVISACSTYLRIGSGLCLGVFACLQHNLYLPDRKSCAQNVGGVFILPSSRMDKIVFKYFGLVLISYLGNIQLKHILMELRKEKGNDNNHQ